ncbi:MAG: transcription elongation factor GreA [Gammaproteobacteria bacterium]|nr:transcription elongation factor GreA [Gammaproteobacteria bacterium]MBT8445357.1 transcription elongation factor GreA [Gammaproteobacteria bacterium]NND36680.1 transcription elongation factor GreA [Gammaproteobacteria bacterium]
MNKHPITQRGADKLREEMRHLKSKERPRIVQAIAEARAHGDLKENAEYHAAKEEQGFVEGRIREIEAKLSHANIIDATRFGSTGKVIFGATVDLLNEDDGTEKTYQIVGEDEADIAAGLVSIGSPMARAMIGKEVGDVAVVNAPGGEKSYEIVEIRYE